MADRDLIVHIVGDSRSYENALKRSETKTAAFAKRIDKVQAGTTLGSRGGLASTALLLRGNALALGAGAGVLALKSVSDAARNAQVILGQTSVAVEQAGLSWEASSKRIQDASTAISLSSAFDDEEVLKSIALFVRSTKDVEKSIKLTSLAADVARGRYTDLAAGTQLVNKANLGQVGALRRAGIAIDKNATSTQALIALQRAFGGASEEFGRTAQGSFDKLNVRLENAREQLGNKLLPTQIKINEALIHGIDLATEFGAALSKIKGPSGQQAFGWLQDGFQKILEFERKLGFPGIRPDSTNLSGPLGAQGRPTPRAATPGLTGPLSATQGQRDAAARDRAREAARRAQLRNQIFDNDIARQLDRALDLGVRQQIARMTEIQGLIQKRIDVTKDVTRKLNLEDQIVAIARTKKDLSQQLIDDAAEAKRRAKALSDQAAATRLAQRTARQFRELGLDAEGNAVTPGLANLQKRIATLSERIAGTKFDTPKLETQLARFRNVLSEGLVPKDVRGKIDEMIRDINDAINDGTKPGGPLTSTTALSSERILAGLGLGRDTERVLRARLSHFNSAGAGLAGAGSGSATIVVQAAPVYLDGQKISANTSKHQNRTRKVNPSHRNGPNAGLIVR